MRQPEDHDLFLERWRRAHDRAVNAPRDDRDPFRLGELKATLQSIPRRLRGMDRAQFWAVANLLRDIADELES